MALRLAKTGFYGGDIENVFNARVDYVMNTYQYEIFTQEYESTAIELNKADK